ncbi:MAG: hypothetical protein WCG27_04580 [Pseudomonadota bacterium]
MKIPVLMVFLGLFVSSLSSWAQVESGGITHNFIPIQPGQKIELGSVIVSSPDGSEPTKTFRLPMENLKARTIAEGQVADPQNKTFLHCNLNYTLNAASHSENFQTPSKGQSANIDYQNSSFVVDLEKMQNSPWGLSMNIQNFGTPNQKMEMKQNKEQAGFGYLSLNPSASKNPKKSGFPGTLDVMVIPQHGSVEHDYRQNNFFDVALRFGQWKEKDFAATNLEGKISGDKHHASDLYIVNMDNIKNTTTSLVMHPRVKNVKDVTLTCTIKNHGKDPVPATTSAPTNHQLQCTFAYYIDEYVSDFGKTMSRRAYFATEPRDKTENLTYDFNFEGNSFTMDLDSPNNITYISLAPAEKRDSKKREFPGSLDVTVNKKAGSLDDNNTIGIDLRLGKWTDKDFASATFSQKVRGEKSAIFHSSTLAIPNILGATTKLNIYYPLKGIYYLQMGCLIK